MNLNKEKLPMLAGGIAGAALLSSYALKNGKNKASIIGYGISGIMLGAGLTDILAIKTGIKKDDGWQSLGDVILVGFGLGSLLLSFGISKIK